MERIRWASEAVTEEGRAKGEPQGSKTDVRGLSRSSVYIILPYKKVTSSTPYCCDRRKVPMKCLPVTADGRAALTAIPPEDDSVFLDKIFQCKRCVIQNHWFCYCHHYFLLIYWLCFAMMRIEPRALHVLGSQTFSLVYLTVQLYKQYLARQVSLAICVFSSWMLAVCEVLCLDNIDSWDDPAFFWSSSSRVHRWSLGERSASVAERTA